MKWLLRSLLLITVLFLLACTGRKELISDNQPVDDSVPIDSSIVRLIEPYKENLDSTMNQVVGWLKTDLVKERNVPESKLSNFVADLTFEYARNYMMNNGPEGTTLPDMCVLNYGGFRSSLSEGEVTRGDIFELMPFDNKVVIVELDYYGIKALVDFLAEEGGEPVSNIRMVIKNKKATEVEIGGKYIEERKYQVVTSDYLANGGDDMEFFVGKPRIELGLLRDVIIDHFQGYDGPLGAKLDGRIRYAE